MLWMWLVFLEACAHPSSVITAAVETPSQDPSFTASVDAMSEESYQISVTHQSEVTLFPGVTPSPSLTATPTQLSPLTTPTVVFEVCSPLTEETIAELWEIISDPYNPPPPGREERHHGVDFSHYQRNGRSSIEGEGVQAIMEGCVAAVIADRLPYGNMIIIETTEEVLPQSLVDELGVGTNESLYHLYAHLESKPDYSLGDLVKCGQIIGAVGLTGYNIVNAHLHLEIRIGPSGATFHGMSYYDTSATEIEMENYIRWRTSGEFLHFDPMLLFSWYLDFYGLLQ